MTSRTRRLGGPPPGWTLPPTWGQPLNDPLPLHAAGMAGRWLYPTVAVGGFLLVAGFMVAHDDPTPGLSARGLLTIALAATVVILLTLRRGAGPGSLARTLGEYTVVFLLAMLLATTGTAPANQPSPAGNQARAAVDQRPALVKTADRSWDRLTGAWDWLTELWRRADTKTAPGGAKGAAPAPAPQPLTWRPL